jgi:hypothetical protein
MRKRPEKLYWIREDCRLYFSGFECQGLLQYKDFLEVILLYRDELRSWTAYVNSGDPVTIWATHL